MIQSIAEVQGGIDKNSDFVFSSTFPILLIQMEVGLRTTPGGLSHQNHLLSLTPSLNFMV